MSTDAMQEDYESALDALADENMDAARECLSRMLDRDADDPRSLEVSGDFARLRGDVKKAERLYGRMAEVSDEPRWLAASLMSRGYLAVELEQRSAARECFEQAIPIFSQLGETELCSQLLASLGTVHEESGDFKQARQAYQQSLAIALERLQSEIPAEEAEELLFVVGSLERELGTVLRLTGNLDEAESIFERARQRFEQLDEPSEVASTLDCLAVIRQIQGRYDQAQAMLEQAIEINQQEEDQAGLSVNYGNLAILHKHLKQFDQAEHFLRLAYKIDQEMGRDDGIADFHMKMGEVCYERGDFQEAEQQLLRALKLHKATGMPEGICATFSHLGVLYRYQHEYVESERMTRQALALAEEMHQVDFIAGALDELALVRKLQGDTQQARQLWQRSLQLFQELESSKMIAEVMQQLEQLGEPNA